MKTLLSMFRMKLLAGLQYRAAAWAGIATQFFWGFMLIMIYEAFYRSSDAVPAMTLSQTCRYIWLQQAFLMLTMMWSRDPEVLELIRSGGIAYELARPVDLYGLWYARFLGQQLSGAALRFLPVLIVACLLPAPYRMTLPPSAAHFALFLLALALSALLGTALLELTYIFTLRTLDFAGPGFVMNALSDFFSGSVILLPFMPRAIRRIAFVLPFRYLADFPYRLYVGNIPLPEAALSLCVSAGWCVILTAGGRLLMRRFLRRAVIQGG